MNTLTRTLFEQTINVASELLHFRQPADAVLSAFFRAHRCGPRERAFIAEAGYALLRRKRSLAAWIGPDATVKQLVLAALVRHCGVSQRMLEAALSKRDADWLSELKAKPEPALTLAEQTDLPDWLIERLSALMPEAELLALARTLNQPAPLDLRVNAQKTNRAAVLAQLAEEGLAATACPYAPEGIRLAGKPFLAKHPLFLDGSIEVQDEGSQLLALLTDPKRGEMVVDFCAGAGGKTLALGACMRNTGRLYAFDTSGHRLDALKPRLARSGLSNVHPAQIAHERDERIKRLAGKIDRVLIDAPCSGLGTLRRNPDLKWRQTPEGVAELSRKQHDILKGASRDKMMNYNGELYKVWGYQPKWHRDPPPLVYFGSNHPQSRKLSARLADGRDLLSLRLLRRIS